jgi:hypothetical protein
MRWWVTDFAHEGQVLDLNNLTDPASGWTLSDATGVNNMRRICGNGTLNGQAPAFLLTPLIDMIETIGIASAAP